MALATTKVGVVKLVLDSVGLVDVVHPSSIKRHVSAPIRFDACVHLAGGQHLFAASRFVPLDEDVFERLEAQPIGGSVLQEGDAQEDFDALYPGFSAAPFLVFGGSDYYFKAR